MIESSKFFFYNSKLLVFVYLDSSDKISNAKQFTVLTSITDQNCSILPKIIKDINKKIEEYTTIIYNIKTTYYNSYPGSVSNCITYKIVEQKHTMLHEFKNMPSNSSDYEMCILFDEELPKILAGRMDADIIPKFINSFRSSTLLQTKTYEEIKEAVSCLSAKEIKKIETNYYLMNLTTTHSSNLFNLQLISEKQQNNLSIKQKTIDKYECKTKLLLDMESEIVVGAVYVPNYCKIDCFDAIKKIEILNLTQSELEILILKEFLITFKITLYSGTRYCIEAFIYEKNLPKFTSFSLKKFSKISFQYSNDDDDDDDHSFIKLDNIKELSMRELNDGNDDKTTGVMEVTGFIEDEYLENVFGKSGRKFKRLDYKISEFNLYGHVKPTEFFQCGASNLFNLSVKSTPLHFEVCGVFSHAFLLHILHKILILKISHIVTYKNFKFYNAILYFRNEDVNFFYKEFADGMEKSHLYYDKKQSNFISNDIVDKAWELHKACHVFYHSYHKLSDIFNLIENVINETKRKILNNEISEKDRTNEILSSKIFKAIIKNSATEEFMKSTTKISPYISDELLAQTHAGILVQTTVSVTSSLIDIFFQSKRVNKSELVLKKNINACAYGSLNSVVSIRPILNITNEKFISTKENTKRFIVDSNAISSCLNVPMYKGSEDNSDAMFMQ